MTRGRGVRQAALVGARHGVPLHLSPAEIPRGLRSLRMTEGLSPFNAATVYRTYVLTSRVRFVGHTERNDHQAPSIIARSANGTRRAAIARIGLRDACGGGARSPGKT